MLVVNHDLKSEKKKAVLFVDVISYRAKLLVLEPVRDLFTIDFECLALPILAQPVPVVLVLLLQLLVRIATRLNDIAYKGD